MNNTNRPIGVFDSGVGGLTVLSSLQAMFPQEDFIYLADHAYCPYGIKSSSQVASRVNQIGKEMISRGVKVIIIACNTATANAHQLIQASAIPIIGVIEPTARKAFQVSKSKKIVLLATDLTVKMEAYQRILSQATVYSLGCSAFVPLAESPDRSSLRTRDIVANHLKLLQNQDFDTIIYGCTHFGLLDQAIQEALPGKNIVECGKPTGDALAEVLLHQKLAKNTSTIGTTTLYTTGDPSIFKEQIPWYKESYKGPYIW